MKSFSQTVSPGQSSLIGRADSGTWRFFIASDRMIRVRIEQKGSLAQIPAKIQYVAPGSSIEIQGSESVFVYADNLDDSNNANVSTWNAQYLPGGLEPVEYAEFRLATPTGGFFGDLGSFGGYPAPFCNMLRIYVDLAQQTRIQATDPDGNTVFQSGVQPVDERLYIDLDAPQAYKWEIRDSNTGGTDPVYYTAIWMRK